MTRLVRALWIVALAALIAGLGCGEAAEPVAAPEPAPDPLAVPAGGFTVVWEGARVSMASRGARRGAVLAELARQAGFQVEGTLPAGRVEMRMEAAALDEALSHLLAGAPWQLEYAPLEAGGHRPLRLRVGGEPAEPEPRPAGPPPSAALLPERELDDPELSRRLRSPVPAERAEALASLDSSGATLEYLVAFALEDPDPDVRMAALAELEGESSWAAVNAVVKALADPDPRVVLRALEAIDHLGDESLLPELLRLSQHRHADVRAAAAELVVEFRD